MSERIVFAKASILFCFTVEMFVVILGLLMSSADAFYVNKLEGVVDLPMAATEQCRTICTKPTRSRTRVDIQIENSNMKCNWRGNVTYVFNHRESYWDYDKIHFREFVGSQTACNKHHGKYRCTLQPEEYCYIEVRLAFNVAYAVHVSTSFDGISNRMINQTKLYNGSVTEQIYLFGSIYHEPEVRFTLQCPNNESCLMNKVTVISLQYRCVDQNSVC